MTEAQVVADPAPDTLPHQLAAAEAERDAAPKQWRHKKRGTVYTEIGRASLQVATEGAYLGEGRILVIYRGEDGKLWARDHEEFEDGRFEDIRALATQQSATGEG